MVSEKLPFAADCTGAAVGAEVAVGTTVVGAADSAVVAVGLLAPDVAVAAAAAWTTVGVVEDPKAVGLFWAVQPASETKNKLASMTSE